MQEISIGLLGYGNVGSAFAKLLGERRASIAKRADLDLRISRIAVRDPHKHNILDLPKGTLSDDPAEVVGDPEVDIIVELIGGIEPPLSLLRQAIANHKPIVTANKALLAQHGAELYAAADTANVDILFEAAVAGGIPLMRPLRASLAGESVKRVMGIVNGTTNYILTQMSEAGITYQDALAQAQALGYAEADPTADVEGHDAGAKAAIIASIVFGVVVELSDVAHEGISAITSEDIELADRMGYVIKAIAVVEAFADPDRAVGNENEIAVRTYPALVPKSHALAAVRNSFNAVFVEGEAVGELMFYGQGAGGLPTASAVLGDVIDAASNLARGTAGRIGTLAPARIRPLSALRSAYYICLAVTDRPGVLAQVAEVFGRHFVSIKAMEQHGQADQARLTFITHESAEDAVQQTMADLEHLDVVLDVHTAIRLVGG